MGAESADGTSVVVGSSEASVRAERRDLWVAGEGFGPADPLWAVGPGCPALARPILHRVLWEDSRNVTPEIKNNSPLPPKPQSPS